MSVNAQFNWARWRFLSTLLTSSHRMFDYIFMLDDSMSMGMEVWKGFFIYLTLPLLSTGKIENSSFHSIYDRIVDDKKNSSGVISYITRLTFIGNSIPVRLDLLSHLLLNIFQFILCRHQQRNLLQPLFPQILSEEKSNQFIVLSWLMICQLCIHCFSCSNVSSLLFMTYSIMSYWGERKNPIWMSGRAIVPMNDSESWYEKVERETFMRQKRDTKHNWNLWRFSYNIYYLLFHTRFR